MLSRPWAPRALTLLSGLLIVASFPPWNLSFLIWVALVPWLLALRSSRGWRPALIQGLWLGVTMCLLGFSWVVYVLHQFGGLPWPVAFVGWLLFSVGGQPQFVIYAALRARLKDFGTPARGAGLALFSLTSALAYAGLDWALPKLFVDTLGHSLFNAPVLRQAADLGTATLLTALIYLVNETLAEGIARVRERKEPSLWPSISAMAPLAALTTALFAATWLYGSSRLAEIRGFQQKPLLFVQGAAVQGNIGDFDKIASERGVRGAAEKVLGTYLGMSEQALSLGDKPDFLVWPETAYPSTFRTPHTSSELERDQKVEAFVRGARVPLLFGGYDRFEKKDYNALFLLSPIADRGLAGTADLQIYRKNVLLLFGEYIPGSEQIKFLQDQFPQVGNFGRGIGPDVLSIPVERAPGGVVKTSPVICYEALFPEYAVGGARKGSQLILNITNDSWFGSFGEPELHQALVAFRSIETRLPQLRATNTGISSLVLPDGEITLATPKDSAEILNARIPILEPVPTLVKRFGDWFGIFAFFSGWLGLGAIAVLGRRGSSAARA